METPIPRAWIEPVVRIVRNGRFEKEILVPVRVRNEWDAQSLGAFLCDVREPIISALLVSGVMGKLIVDQPEPGETYAFWFHYKTGDEIRKFYGKICLYND